MYYFVLWVQKSMQKQKSASKIKSPSIYECKIAKKNTSKIFVYNYESNKISKKFIEYI